MDKNKKIVALGIILCLFTIPGRTQNISIMNGKDYSNSLYDTFSAISSADESSSMSFRNILRSTQWLNGHRQTRYVSKSLKHKAQQYIQSYFYHDESGPHLKCDSVDSLQNLFAFDQSAHIIIIDITSLQLGKYDLTLVYYYSGSGIIKQNIQVFKKESGILILDFVFSMDVPGHIECATMNDFPLFFETIYPALFDFYSDSCGWQPPMSNANPATP